jgi:hypothetical protein
LMGVQFKQRSACNVKPLGIYLPRNLCGIVSRRHFALLNQDIPNPCDKLHHQGFCMAPLHRLSSLVPVHRRPPWNCMQISLRPGSRLFYWKVAVGDQWDDIRIFPQTPILGCLEWAATW